MEATVASQAARLGHYEMLEQDIDGAILQIGDGAAVEGGGPHELQLMRTVGSAMPTAVQRRVQQSLTLARKCAPRAFLHQPLPWAHMPACLSTQVDPHRA